MIPLLYVEGLSTRDFRRALKPLWGESGLSPSSVSRANRALKESFNNWRRRDLSLEEIVYLFPDGIYLGVSGGSREKEAILVAHGINREGKRVVLHLSLGGRESTESRKGTINDPVGRGLKPPQLIISDGNPGLLRAIKDIWPQVPRQRCIVHRMRNVPAKHLEECFTFYRFPERHWKYIRTSNVLERAFKEVKRRTKVVGRFPTETSALIMVFGILEEKKLKWQKVTMRPEDIAWIEETTKLLEEEPIRLGFPDEHLVA